MSGLWWDERVVTTDSWKASRGRSSVGETSEGGERQAKKERGRGRGISDAEVSSESTGSTVTRTVWKDIELQLAGAGQATLTTKVKREKGEVLWRSKKYFLSVLFDDFCGTHCGACFSEIALCLQADQSEKAVKLQKMLVAYPQLKGQILKSYTWSCKGCNKFLLCSKCDREETKRWHRHECELFCNVPKEMRAGHTDYLRFGCRFFATCTHGAPPLIPSGLPGSSLLRPTEELEKVFRMRCKAKKRARIHFLDCLDTNRKLQPSEFSDFCKGMAKTFKRYVPFPQDYSEDHLVDLLMRVRTNGLGFPCSDKYGSLGWSLDLYASFLDHSCIPNCKVDMDKEGNVVVETLSKIDAGSKLLISYAIESRTAEERKKHLFDLYRFHCRCQLCKNV